MAHWVRTIIHDLEQTPDGRSSVVSREGRVESLVRPPQAGGTISIRGESYRIIDCTDVATQTRDEYTFIVDLVKLGEAAIKEEKRQLVRKHFGLTAVPNNGTHTNPAGI